MSQEIPQDIKDLIIQSQKNEITEYHIYTKLAAVEKLEENSKVLMDIAQDELAHHDFWQKFTDLKVKPSRFKIFIYYWMARILGLTFSIKLMERGEEGAQKTYETISQYIPEAKKIIDDENSHEQKLIAMLQEEKLKYVGSIVLGLNDALVELTGTLAGLTFALQNTQLIAMAGLITGIAASLSMAASEYLSTQNEEGDQDALRSSIYTGIAYILTVIILVLPYLLFSHYFVALGVTLLNAILIILFFNYYISVARDLPFKKRFLGMAGISLGVAALSFFIGFLVRAVLGVEV